MNRDELESQLSAMFDGELPAAECELLARRIDREENLRACWARYALIGAAMRSEPVATARRGFAARDAYHSQYGHLGEGAAGNKHSLRIALKAGRRDLDATIEQRQQVVRHHALEHVVIAELQPDPQSIQLRPAQKRFSLRLMAIAELAHEIDAAHILKAYFAVLALACQ